MTDIFDGDPFITIDPDGANLVFSGGQPKMDQGLINHVNISLLTKKGWCGNDIEPVAERKIGSDFLEKNSQSITRQSLLDISKTAEATLVGDEFGKITAIVTNPISQQVRTDILLEPTSGDISILRLTKSGQNWLNQKINPSDNQ